jgi:hypothetical protein
MFQRVSKNITPASVLALVALVFAITGGAFAASGGGSSPSHATLTAIASKAKPKAKTAPRGPAGPKGATGVTGATGPAGPAGATGPGGSAGPAGAKGETGAGGATGPAGSQGEKGTPGNEGPEGNDGKEGSPWTAGGTLPSGKTETGTWGARFEGTAEAFSFSSISFPIPLAASLTDKGPGEEHTYYVTLEEQKEEKGQKDPAGCEGEPKPGEKVKGTVENPQAAKGNLCLYEGGFQVPAGERTRELGVTAIIRPEGEMVGDGGVKSGAGTAGAVATIHYAEGAETEAAALQGTWAVTAP